MKKAENNRYPHSADLFRFCKEALNVKHNFEVKVIDQHVGLILGYDPADCSHWKKGKKNIKSVQTLGAIAKHLDVDPCFVADIAAGKISLEESLYEYRGYGAFNVSMKFYDDLKREYFKNPQKFLQDNDNRSFDSLVDTNRSEILKMTQSILAAANVQSVPVMIPEIISALKSVQLREGQTVQDKLVSTTVEDGQHVIWYRDKDFKPYTRYLIAREIGRIKLFPQLTETEDEVGACKINLFAMLLLIPGESLQKATRRVDGTHDLVQQLSEIFWIGRPIVNARIKDFFAHGS